jgi:hypothetical protein
VTPPETTFLHLKKPKKSTSKYFAFKSSESPSSFRCRLDHRRFRTCGASRAYRNLEPGRHRFEVFAVDAAGNADPTPAVARFKVPAPKQHEVKSQSPGGGPSPPPGTPASGSPGR